MMTKIWPLWPWWQQDTTLDDQCDEILMTLKIFLTTSDNSMWFEIFLFRIGRLPENGKWIYQILSCILMPKYYPFWRKTILLDIFILDTTSLFWGEKTHCRVLHRGKNLEYINILSHTPNLTMMERSSQCEKNRRYVHINFDRKFTPNTKAHTFFLY